MAHQGWGVRFISRYFAGLLADRRVHPEFMPLIERYVEHSVIPEVRQGFAQLFELNGAGVSRSRDLVDVVRRGAPGHDAKAQAELYQRLVLSFVGFTGVTLEWILFVVGTSADPHRYITEPDALVNETLRLYPTAWRLVRTARNSHDIESYPVNPGESVLLSINAAHRDPHVWPVAEVFDPGRWSNLTPAERRAFMPFGRGREMCPASRFAMKALCAATASILSGHAVSVSVRSRAKPKALTLLAPPAGFTRLLPIDQTMRASSTSGAKSAAAR
jgi:hypothetical protein